jgi:hypothetical protein
MPADSSTRNDAFRSLAPPTVVLIVAELDLVALLERPGSGNVVAVAEEVDQDASTSWMEFAYMDASLQKSRVSVIFPSRGMMASAATGAVLRAYLPVNL